MLPPLLLLRPAGCHRQPASRLVVLAGGRSDAAFAAANRDRRSQPGGGGGGGGEPAAGQLVNRSLVRLPWTPLLAVYGTSVLRGEPPICVTQISIDEFERLGTEGFGTVVGNPRPSATFGLFVDDHLVWPRTPPRGPVADDPGFGTS